MSVSQLVDDVIWKWNGKLSGHINGSWKTLIRKLDITEECAVEFQLVQTLHGVFEHVVRHGRGNVYLSEFWLRCFLNRKRRNIGPKWFLNAKITYDRWYQKYPSRPRPILRAGEVRARTPTPATIPECGIAG